MPIVASTTTDMMPSVEVVAAPKLFARLRRMALGSDAQRASLAVFDQGIVSGLSFATSAIIATSSGRMGLGIAHLALTLLTLMMNVQGELLNAPYTVYRGGRRGRRLEAYSGSIMIHQAVLAAFGMFAVLVVLGLNSVGIGPAELRPALWVLLAASPFCLLHAFLRNFSFAAFQFRVAVAMDVTVAVLQMTTLIVLVRLDMLTVPRIFAVMGTASLVACAGWFVMKPEPIRLVRGLVLKHWSENWSFGRWALASHIVGCAGTYVLPWLLVFVHDQAATGTLAGCAKLSALAATFVAGVAHFLTPKAVAAFNESGAAGLKRVLFVSGVVFAVTVGGFCVVVGLTGDWLLVRLFGQDFVGTGSIALVLSFAVLANSMAVLGGNGLWAINRPQANLISDIAAVTLTLVTAAVLVQTHGVMGIAVSMLVGGIVGAIVRGITLFVLMRRLECCDLS
jgi:O-antigen/teichoic acid export membrane protein